MASSTAMPGRRRKRREMTGKSEGKRFECQNEGCGRSFTRGEHLQRHLLNHSTGEYTCGRCRAHFKRRDLLDRHIARHRQKDEEAGAEGYGVLNTRKRMWKDAEGRIVTKKPTLSNLSKDTPLNPPLQNDYDFQSLQNLASFAMQEEDLPISPPTSNNPSLPNSLEDHDSGVGRSYHSAALDPASFSAQDAGAYSPIDPRFWSTDVTQTQSDSFPSASFDDTSFDDIFNPDTASSFNAPFTTMSNYNWLFDTDWSKNEHAQNLSVQDPFPVSFNNNTALPQQQNPIFDVDLEHANVEKGPSDMAFGPLPLQLSELMSPHSSPSAQTTVPVFSEQSEKAGNEAFHADQDYSNIEKLANANVCVNAPNVSDLERPMSLLHPSRSLPIIDELARLQLLDLIDIMQPTSPDGSIVMRSHPLLSLPNLQVYSDLFFTQFNTTYPLIHMSTFAPSEVEPLLLASILLLGATYSSKDAHQLAVCIHDVLRPQIFANTGFSAKPELWVLQTLLLTECFGKSRAGQRQHDMAHLFHGLLINLIRRSECQNIRCKVLDEGGESRDLEDEWRTWCEAESKKRLAFLCFTFDTQHALLFCQSLCMSAFELRSSLPYSQSLWEAPTAQHWHHLRLKQPHQPPLFLSCLKTYLHPAPATAASMPPPASLNAFSRSLLLHGLMSIACDMHRRDQTALSSAHPLGNWKQRLAASYDSWAADFLGYSKTYLSRLSSSSSSSSNSYSNTSEIQEEFKKYKTATMALFHAAHILLHTPFLDLQIYAGAKHILGRAVARADYVRSQRVVKRWVAEQKSEVGHAVGHAAKLVRDGVDIWDGGSRETSALGSAVVDGRGSGSSTTGAAGGAGGTTLFHHPWSIYLSTLVIWAAWYAQPTTTCPPDPSSQPQPTHFLRRPSHASLDETHDPAASNDDDPDDDDDDDDDEIIWNPRQAMTTLLSTLLATTPPPGKTLHTTAYPTAVFSSNTGKKGVNGLAAVVSKWLGKVRWAVVHDGMMVIKGLVEWRVIGDGNASGSASANSSASS